MQLLGSRYKAANPGSKVQVIGFEPRPLLKITPSSSASDRRVKSYNFIDAVRMLPTNFTATETSEIMEKINNPRLLGKMRSLFIVLSDDDYRQKMHKSGPKEAGPSDLQSTTSAGHPQMEASDPAPGLSASSNSGSKSGSKGKFQEKSGSSGSGGKSGSSSSSGKSGNSVSGGKSGSSGNKNLKRGAESDTSLESNPPKK